MNEIINAINKPIWWFTVVLAGLLINFLASILYKIYESYIVKRSTIRQKNLEEIEHEKVKIATLIKKNLRLQNHFQFRILENKIETIRWFIFGLIFFLFPLIIFQLEGVLNYLIFPFFFLLAFLFLIFGFKAQKEANTLKDILEISLKDDANR